MRKTATIALLSCAIIATLRPSLYAADRKLALLLPQLFGAGGLVVDSEAFLPGGTTHSAHFNAAFQAQFGPTAAALNSALGRGLAAVASPSPASGFTYAFDPAAGVFIRSSESYGPVLGERAETIGRNRLAGALVYQHFEFDRIGEVSLDTVPFVFTHDSPGPGGREDVVAAPLSVSLVQDQATLLLVWGVAETLDLALVFPVIRTELEAVARAEVLRLGTTLSPAVHFFRGPGGEYGSTREYRSAGSATGVGDLLLRAKKTLKGARGGRGVGVALGLELRVPTGDAENLLGSGAFGVRPLLIASLSRGRSAVHVNGSYQWNGESVLAGDIVTGTKGSLPDVVRYSMGLDVGVSKQTTLSLDLLGTHSLGAVRLSHSTFTALDRITQVPVVEYEAVGTSALELALGAKFNVAGKLLFDTSLLWSLKNDGLRDRFVPLFALEYSF